MKRYQSAILIAALGLATTSLAMAVTKQDEVLFSVVMSNEPIIILRGEGQLTDGQASIDLPANFEALVDSDKATQCFVSAVANNTPAAASLDKAQKKLNVQGNGNNRFHWLVIGTPKSGGLNHNHR